MNNAKAGADFVDPSAMMDEQVKIIREALDENGYKNTGILYYSIKFASNFYFPFKDVMKSAQSFGDRSSCQMDFANDYQYINELELKKFKQICDIEVEKEIEKVIIQKKT